MFYYKSKISSLKQTSAMGTIGRLSTVVLHARINVRNSEPIGRVITSRLVEFTYTWHIAKMYCGGPKL